MSAPDPYAPPHATPPAHRAPALGVVGWGVVILVLAYSLLLASHIWGLLQGTPVLSFFSDAVLYPSRWVLIAMITQTLLLGAGGLLLHRQPRLAAACLLVSAALGVATVSYLHVWLPIVLASGVAWYALRRHRAMRVPHDA